MKRTSILIVLLLLLAATHTIVDAQKRVIKYEGGRKKGVVASQDSLKKIDSLSPSVDTSLMMVADTLAVKDSLLKIDTKRGVDTSFLSKTTLSPKLNIETKPKTKKWNLTQDTIPAGKLTLLSLIPGVGQVYNRQYWKVPVIYGVIGGFVAGGIISSNSYNNYKADWQRTVNLNMPQNVQDAARARMDREGTTRTLLYSMAAATYLYQVADATFNYRGKVDHIRKATTLAAIFPGAGFVYTRTYWRLPIYYGGFITLASVIDFNNRSYERYSRAYNSMTDNDPTTHDEFNGRYSADALRNTRNQYRRNRDLGIIAILGAYVLSIVDTHVIATLKNWDVSPNLNVSIEPTVINNSIHKASVVPSGAGLSMKLKF